MKRMFVVLLALGAGATACARGGPSEARGGPSKASGAPSVTLQVACEPFQHMVLLGPSSGSGEIAGSVGPVPTKWVNQLLRSGNGHLVDYAKTFVNGRASSEVVGEIQSECHRLGA